MAGTRETNRRQWLAIRNAEFDAGSLAWLQGVAAALLKADDIPGDNARRAALPAALGLAGHYRGPKGPTAAGPFEAAAERRATARSRWESLALGELDRTILLWVANVAGDVLAADNEVDKNTRRARLAEAVGLVGPFSVEAEAVRQIARDADHTSGLIEQHQARQPARGERSRRRRSYVYAAVRTADRESPETIDARIKRALRDDAE